MITHLSCSDLRQVLTDTVADNGIIFDELEIRQLVEVVIEECKGRKCSNTQEDVNVSYIEMKALLENQAGLAVAIGTRWAARWIALVFAQPLEHEF